jgi:hypothetical protein
MFCKKCGNHTDSIGWDDKMENMLYRKFCQMCLTDFLEKMLDEAESPAIY